jgi:uncharacterized phage protein gp47/JayE
MTMQLPLQNFSALIQTMAAGVQGAASQLLDLTVGSVLRAILEANASVALWLQWLIVRVLGVTRAATSTGPDLDSWVADFSFFRLPARIATGTVTLARYTATLGAFVPLATQIRSSDGSQSFSIMSDPTNSTYNAALGGYTLAAGIASISVPVVAAAPGAAGNIQAGTATVLASAIAGVDTVTNPLAFAGGADAEPDSDLRTRFANYIQTLSRATTSAIGSALEGLQQEIAYAIAENSDAAGNPMPGSFLVTVDDGSGSPPASLLSAAIGAVETMRPIGAGFAVQPPVIATANVTMAITVSDPTTQQSTVATVRAALESSINLLPIGAPLAWSRLAQIAYDASPLVTNVTGIVLNGGTADVTIPGHAVIKAGTVMVS